MNNMERGRRRRFWLLKKWSSYTVWEHYATVFDAFVKAYEEAVANWPEGEAPPERNLRFAYEAQELYPQGLAALKLGDRTVWRNREDGYLGHAAFAVLRATESITSEEINRYDGGERGTPRYDSWTPRLEQLRLLKEQVSPLGGILVYEPQPASDAKPTAAYGLGDYDVNAILDEDAPSIGFTPALCPAAPAVSGILIESGESIPVDGIWELALPEQPAGKTDRLNYFLKKTVAPWVNDPSKGYVPGKQFVLPVTWRLVWEDTRYQDGKIPDELEYLSPTLDEPESATATLPDEALTGRVEGNRPCPRTGFWYTPAKQDSRQRFEKNQNMPVFSESNYGATIWYWDANQETD